MEPILTGSLKILGANYHILAKFCCWAIFIWRKWPNIEDKNLTIWSHWLRDFGFGKVVALRNLDFLFLETKSFALSFCPSKWQNAFNLKMLFQGNFDPISLFIVSTYVSYFSLHFCYFKWPVDPSVPTIPWPGVRILSIPSMLLAFNNL